MKYDVFISYSTQDQKVVEGLSAYLEQHNIRCFVAYRDIPTGVVWAKAITEAIEESQMMVVVFSSNFNKSEQVDREIELASEDKRPILTFRISNTAFSGAKKYYLKNLNWIDAFPDPQKQFGTLLDSVSKLLGIKNYNADVRSTISDSKYIKTNSAGRDVKVKFRTDTNCKIFIDNEEMAEMGADDVKIIPLLPGEYIVKFQSLHFPHVKDMITISLTKEMASKVYDIHLLEKENQQATKKQNIPNDTKTILQVSNISDNYNVILLNAGSAKLQIVKAVYEFCNMGLKEAKDLVDSAPSIIKRNLSYSEAQKLQHVLTDAGGLIEIQSYEQTREEASSIIYNVILKYAGLAKLQLVKTIKEVCNMGLKEAKDLVDSAPSIIKRNLSYSEAQTLKKVLEEAGGIVEIQTPK